MRRGRLFALPVAALLGLGAAGCVVIEGTSGAPLPDPERVDALLAARAPRAAVLAELGPSDEYRSPRPLQARDLEPLAVRVAEDGRLLLPDTLSWTRERRLDRRFVLLPVLNLFSWRHEHREVERLRLRFDADDRLAAATRLEGGGG